MWRIGDWSFMYDTSQFGSRRKTTKIFSDFFYSLQSNAHPWSKSTKFCTINLCLTKPKRDAASSQWLRNFNFKHKTWVWFPRGKKKFFSYCSWSAVQITVQKYKYNSTFLRIQCAACIGLSLQLRHTAEGSLSHIGMASSPSWPSPTAAYTGSAASLECQKNETSLGRPETVRARTFSNARRQHYVSRLNSKASSRAWDRRTAVGRERQ